MVKFSVYLDRLVFVIYKNIDTVVYIDKQRMSCSAFRTFVRFALVWFSQFPLPLGRAAVSDCGTPWTFLLPFFVLDPLEH